MEQIELTLEDVQWAMKTARASFARWENQQGYYNNRLNSHFKGKLGELAVENFLASKSLKFDSHFRFSDRENLADIVLKLKGYKKIARIEVKTWSANYWEELGRCISVDQLFDLRKKSDIIIWCTTDTHDTSIDLMHTTITIRGWSTINDVQNAPVTLTGLDSMRKVKNYQLPSTDIHDTSNFFDNLTTLKHSH